jgi:CspA family cold shock protein
MEVGTVKSFNPQVGFGFIEMESGREIFFHQTEILMKGFRTIEPGTPVEYSVGSDKRGRPKAVKVRHFKPADWQTAE